MSLFAFKRLFYRPHNRKIIYLVSVVCLSILSVLSLLNCLTFDLNTLFFYQGQRSRSDRQEADTTEHIMPLLCEQEHMVGPQLPVPNCSFLGYVLHGWNPSHFVNTKFRSVLISYLFMHGRGSWWGVPNPSSQLIFRTNPSSQLSIFLQSQSIIG